MVFIHVNVTVYCSLTRTLMYIKELQKRISCIILICLHFKLGQILSYSKQRISSKAIQNLLGVFSEARIPTLAK